MQFFASFKMYGTVGTGTGTGCRRRRRIRIFNYDLLRKENSFVLLIVGFRNLFKDIPVPVTVTIVITVT